MGQHEAGKHSKAGKARAAKQPRVPKSSKTNPKKGQTGGGVYHSNNAKGPGLLGGLLGGLFGKKK